MKKLYRTTFIMLGIVSFILTVGFCLQIPLVSGILPPAGSFPLHVFLASITASITASLLWIGFSGELGAVRGGAIDLAVFYGGLTIFQLFSKQHLLAGVLLCLVAAIVSLSIFLRFRRYPIEDNRPMPLPVRIFFGVFVAVLLLVGCAILLQVPNVFISSVKLPSLIINTLILLYSSALAIYYLLIKKETRSRINIASLSSQAMLLLEWSR